MVEPSGLPDAGAKRADSGSITISRGGARSWRFHVCWIVPLLAGLAGWGWHFSRPRQRIAPPAVSLADADPAVAEKVEQARAAVEQDPSSAGAWGHLGELFLAHAMLPEAETCLTRAVQLDPADGRWAYLRAVLLARTNTQESIPALEQAAALCGSMTAPRLKLGEILLGEGRLDEAQRQFQSALGEEPGNPRAELGLGRVAHARGRWQESMQHLKRSAEAAPGMRSTHALLAEVYQRLGDTPLARRELDLVERCPEGLNWPDPYLEAVDRLKTGAEARLQLAQNLIGQGRTQEGLALMQESIRNLPDSYALRLAYGLQLLQSGPPKEAEVQFRKTAELRPDSYRAHTGLGLALMSQNKFREASTCFRTALSLNPNNAMAQYNLGLCLTRLGDRPGGIEAFRIAIKCKPDLAEAHRDLAELLINTGRSGEAADHLRDALRLAPNDAKAKKLLAQIAASHDPR